MKSKENKNLLVVIIVLLVVVGVCIYKLEAVERKIIDDENLKVEI